jgi:heptosyltransferase-1/heptosyltransferase-2
VNTPRRILIIKPSSLGDVATTLPLLCDLHRALPKARIDWLVHPAFAVLLRGHEALDRILEFDRKQLAAWWYKPAAWRLFRELLRKLRSAEYDCVIDAQGLFRSGFFARITGAATRIGFASAREGAPLAYTHRVRLPDRGRHMLAVDRMRALLGPLEIDTTCPAEFRLPIQPAAAAWARDLLGATRPIVVIPGARWNTKRWPLERYTAVVRQLAAARQPVVLAGSPDEKPLCDEIAAAVPAVRNLAGQTGLAEMIALLDRAKLVLGNDSGPLHVAVALRKPIVAIYGPTAPDFVGPYGQLANVLRHDVPCHPCRRRECDHHSCMQGVSVELVWDKTRRAAGID